MLTPTRRRRFSKCFSSMVGCLHMMMPHTGFSSIRATRAVSIRRLSRKTTAFCTRFRRTRRSSRARIRRRLKLLRSSKLAAITSGRHHCSRRTDSFQSCRRSIFRKCLPRRYQARFTFQRSRLRRRSRYCRLSATNSVPHGAAA